MATDELVQQLRDQAELMELRLRVDHQVAMGDVSRALILLLRDAAERREREASQ